VSSAADLEIDAILPFERDFAIVQPPGQMHDPECPDQRFGIETS
jgi:hypothetical protein